MATMLPLTTAVAAEADHRQLRREFQAVSAGTRRFDSPQELFSLYVAPLVRIFGSDALPESLTSFASPSSSSSSSGTAGGRDGVVDVLLVEAVQDSLLSRIVVDWSHSLDPAQLKSLMEGWFFGLPQASSSASLATKAAKRGAVQLSALRTISRFLSTASLSSQKAAVHSLTLATLKQLCVSGLSHLSLSSLLDAVQGEKNRARSDVVWNETLRLLSSLPDRLANATEGNFPQGFSATAWTENVFVKGIAIALNDTASLDRERIKLLKDVVGRLEKMGYLSRAVDTDGRGFWVAFLHAVLNLDAAARNWPKLRAKLSSRLRARLDLLLVETLQYLTVVKQGLPNSLVAVMERSKPGTEGVVFLSKASQVAVAALALLFETFLNAPYAAFGEGDGEGSDSSLSDDNLSPTVSLFKGVALSRVHQSPLLARAWPTYLRTSAELLECLEATLEAWSSPARISRSLLEEEVFLTTLIVTLLSSVTALKEDEEDVARLVAISRSRAVLDGVSSHLSHSDATVRRLGMLVAEVLSGKVPSPGGVNGKWKTLSFGSKIWNGTGEGREEARVLRALGDAWSHHREAIEGVREGWRTEPGKSGLGDALAVLGISERDDEVARSEGTQLVMAETRKLGKPKTRLLPERVAPPSRSGSNVTTGTNRTTRPLITMIDSDEEEDVSPTNDKAATASPLAMFSNTSTSRHGTRSSPSSASSSTSSSSDDSDSDVAPDTAEADIQKLAAELSGLSPNEASSILSNHPPFTPPALSSSRSSAKPQPRSRHNNITDLDNNREAHAPTFTKRSPPPVYISQLSPLLKSSSRAEIKIGLKHAAALIRRKSNSATFGGEVEENAIDLTLTLIALHDNFGIRRFEEMRREALKALAVGSARTVVGVLAEQVFGSQYSGVQRMAMLSCIAESAVELSSSGAEEEENGEQGKRKRLEVGRKADQVASTVVAAAKEMGESQVPAIRRQRALHVQPSHSSNAGGGGGKLVQVLDSTNTSSSFHSSSALTLKTSGREERQRQWQILAGPTYIFPLLNRFLAYHSAFSSRSTSAYAGAGTRALFNPQTQALFLDTLTILVSLAPASLLSTLTGSVLDVILVSLSPFFSGETRGGEGGGGGENANVETASAFNLLAVLLHRALELDAGEFLVSDQQVVATLRTLLVVVQDTFTTLQSGMDSKGGKGGGGGTRMKILSRAATILLLMDRLDQLRQDLIKRAIGFVPAS